MTVSASSSTSHWWSTAAWNSAQPGVGLPRGLDRIDEADAAAEQAEVRADRRRREVPDPLQRAARRPGVAEIVAHQPLDLLLRLGAGVSERLGRLLLKLVAEHVLVASGHQVQHRADAEQIILRFLETRRLDRTTGQERRIGQARNRPRRPQVAQRARRFLHVRLELIQRVVEARVPRVDERRRATPRCARASRAGGTSP